MVKFVILSQSMFRTLKRRPIYLLMIIWTLTSADQCVPTDACGNFLFHAWVRCCKNESNNKYSTRCSKASNGRNNTLSTPSDKYYKIIKIYQSNFF